MRCLTCAVLSCVFTLCHAAVLNRPDGGALCPPGSRCLPFSQCTGAAHSALEDGLRRRSCDSAARELGVCCGEVAALTDLSPPFQRHRRSVSSTPPTSPSPPLPKPPAPSPSPPKTPPAPTPTTASGTLSPKPTRKPTATPASKPPTPLSKPNVTSAPPIQIPTTPSGNGKPQNVSPSARACEKFRKYDEGLAGTFLLRQKRRENVNVVGGERARNREFVYMVAVGYVRGNNSANTSEILWGCGGSLVSDRYVLTAAHCITDAQRQGMRPVVLRAGVNRLSAGPRAPGDFSVESIVLHPRHAPQLHYFDLALLRTDRAVPFSASVLPVCLAQPTTRVDANATLLVAGWGAVDPAGFEPSADLKKALLRFVNLDECKKFITKSKSLPRGLDTDMICAADPKGQADTCRGDSGGPLAARGPQGDVLVGVTSFGGRPCAGSRPSVYARVQPELSWIESIVWS